VLTSNIEPLPTLDHREPCGLMTLDEAEAARNRATCRLRDAEHWRRLVEARLDLAVAAVADIDDLDHLEATLVELRALIGMPSSGGRLAESSLLIRLRSALIELDGYITEVKREVDDATADVAARIVADPAPERRLETGPSREFAARFAADFATR
jgi:hypothetical protein